MYQPIKVLKAQATKEGIRLCSSRMILQVGLLVVESDALDVVKILNRECVDLTEITLVIDKIIFLAQCFEHVSFSFCKSARNSIAHRLAWVVVGLEGVVELCGSM